MNPIPTKRGFIISVDAILATVILFSLLTLAYDALKQDGIDIQVKRELSMVAYQSGENLEISGALYHSALNNNTSEIRQFLDGLPANLCESVSIVNGPTSTTPVFSIAKPGCSSITGDFVRSSRGFIVASPPDANLYVATISVWVDQGS